MTRSGNCRRIDSMIYSGCRFNGRWPGLMALAIWSLFLAACSSGQIERSPSGPAMDLAMGIYERGESLRSLAARGGASYTVDQKRHYFKFEALVIKPGWLLFTAFDPAGRPAFKLASDGSQLSGLIYGSNQYVIGPATASNFSRFIPLGLSPDQLIALMSGSQVRPASAGAKESDKTTELMIVPTNPSGGDNDLWRIRVAGALRQNPATAEIRSASFGPARKPKISIRYPSLRQISREDLGKQMEPFPASVEVDWTGEDGKNQNLRVTYDEVRLGLTLDESLFRLDRPDGFELMQLY